MLRRTAATQTRRRRHRRDRRYQRDSVGRRLLLGRRSEVPLQHNACVRQLAPRVFRPLVWRRSFNHGRTAVCRQHGRHGFGHTFQPLLLGDILPAGRPHIDAALRNATGSVAMDARQRGDWCHRHAHQQHPGSHHSRHTRLAPAVLRRIRRQPQPHDFLRSNRHHPAAVGHSVGVTDDTRHRHRLRVAAFWPRGTAARHRNHRHISSIQPRQHRHRHSLQPPCRSVTRQPRRHIPL